MPALPRFLVAVTTTLALLAGLHGQAAEAVRDRKAPDKPWTPSREASVPGEDAKILPRKANPADQKALEAARPVVWPTAGTAQVAVPKPAVDWTGVLAGRAAAPKLAKAGHLPLEVASKDAPGPDKLDVELLGRRADAVLLRIKRADGIAKASPLSVRFDYRGFQHAYGGDWSSRLRLVSLPSCALTTPAKDTCAARPVATRNDGSGWLTADLVTGPDAELFAVQAGPSGPAGDFGASSLAPSATWQAGGSSGDFGWKYPMDAPPATGGPEAELALEYSSGNVDGRTTATNNQPSWAGEGFEFSPGGSIERRYASCQSKSEQSGTNGDRKIGDLCWATDNAMFTLGGKGGELIRDDATGVWRARDDDGTTIERFTGASNGDNDGEYWVVTGEDGTKYYFGLNRPAGWSSGKPETQSAWTVPVFGNHKNEPCYNSSFSSAHCQQAYKWNLDYVVDRHGNTMSFFYDVETNYYARNASNSSVSKYVRAGNIKRIEYGQRDGAIYTSPAVARVLMTTADRCLPGTTCTTSQPNQWPDTPLDQLCTSSSKCENKFTPTFWTQKRLAKVTTEVWRGAKFEPVTSWTLRHGYPNPGDGTRAGLWLEGINSAGHVGGTTTTPEVNFHGVQLPNRVVGTDGIPAMNWWRVSAIHYGTGGELAVAYSAQDCSLPGNVPAPDTNGKRCHPAKWTPEGQAERQDWFNKFVVTQVTESDRVSGLEPVVTKYDYLTPPAWRHDEEDGLVEIGKKTWAQWRGYERVRTTKGSPGGLQSVTEQRFFRGMDGDKLANGSVKDVRVTDSTGEQVEDLNPLAGQVREQLTYDGTTLVDRTINEQWVSAPRATRVRSWGTTKSYQVEDSVMRQDEANGSGWRQRRAVNTYTADGTITAKSELNGLTDPADDTCTRFTYAENPAAGLRELPIRQQVVAKACDQPWTKDDVVQDERAYYDGSSTFGDKPSKGDVTKVEELSGFDAAGQPVYKTSHTATFDTLGRDIGFTDALGKTTTREYSPATGPVATTITTQPNGHTVSTSWEPAWGEETSVTGPDGRRTETAFDPLGRTEKVWLPGRNRSDTPNFAYQYLMRADGAGAVKTTTLQATGSLETSIELLDGLLRPRQQQEPAPGGGRVITDYVYDSRGQQVKENGPYYNSAPISDQVLIPREQELPLQKVTVFDGAERPTTEIVKSRNTEKWRTTYGHGAGVHTIKPPTGEQPVTRITDVQGRLVELRQYTGSEPSGTYDSTKYTYHPAGQLASVVDPAGNQWTFSYDVRGRKIEDSDPDKGVTKYTYDDLDRLTSSTDGRGSTLAYAYDDIGRRTAVHDGSLSGPKRAAWTYDSLAKGLPTAATRYVNGQPYTTKVTGYDQGGRALGLEVVLPAAEGALAGTYTIGSTYNADGEVATTKLPGIGGLPEETLQYGYNDQDLPTTLTGATSYVGDTTYTPFGELETVTLAQNGGKWVQQSYEYESGTRRLTRAMTQRETLPQRISDITFGYDPAGNVKQITNTPDAELGEATDTQCFKYDHLRRLTDAWTPASNNCAEAPAAEGLGGPAPYWHAWTFDKVGNRTSETKQSAAGKTTSTYEYPEAGQPRPHAVQKVTTSGASGSKSNSYEYDAAGNMSTRTLAGTEEVLAWDAEGRLEKVTKAGQTTSFVYDADGTRLLRRDSSGTTFYFGDTELLLEPSGKVTGTRYYSHTKKTVAIRVGDKVTWLGNDHHGTPELAIDADNQTYQRRRTTPYGELRGAAPTSWPGQKSFVGGTHDPSTNLIHLEAREYDPTIGKFISVDPVADYEDAQQLNGYAYANNNPVTYSDPDGRLFWIPLIIMAIRLIPVVIRVVQVVTTMVRVVTPVVRTVTTVARGPLGQLINRVNRFVTHVTRVKPVTKRIPQLRKSTQRVPTRMIRRVPVRPPKAAVKKPVTQAKPQARRDVRNTNNNQRPPNLPKDPKGGKKDPSESPPVSKVLLRTADQLKKKFKHAKQFDSNLKNYNPKNATEFSRAIHRHVNNPGTREIQGHYNGSPVTHYFNEGSSLNVIATRGQEFVSGPWKLGPKQVFHLLKDGKLGGH